MHSFIADILELYLDIKHWFKIRKRRKFEKKHNLPKKRMMYPSTKIGIVLLIISIPLLFFKINRFRKQGENSTKDKLREISIILAADKKQLGFYPTSLKTIIRNNPLRQNITVDYWKNEFIYSLSKDSLNYSIISSGKDEKLATSDDIKITN